MRQAYWWIANNAVICPYYDVEYGARTALTNASGDEVVLHDSMSYSSFVLIPIVTVESRGYALLVPSLTALPVTDLRHVIADLADDRERIMGALDYLFMGA